jgi:hypothetical protein
VTQRCTALDLRRRRHPLLPTDGIVGGPGDVRREETAANSTPMVTKQEEGNRVEGSDLGSMPQNMERPAILIHGLKVLVARS